MKVLLVSNVFDGTGWSVAGQRMALAMDRAGLDVAIRPLKLNSFVDLTDVPPRILELVDTDPVGSDVCIQHVLPHLSVYDGRFARNICLFASETSHFRNTNWADHLNLLDEVWVVNHQQERACRDSGVTRPIQVVPHPVVTVRAEPVWELLSGEIFRFYNIGEWSVRKNQEMLLRAYFTEFDGSENVELVLKTSVPGRSPEQALEQVRQAIAEVKRNLKLDGPGRFRDPVVLTRRLSAAQMAGLHQQCDCFVTASRGEACCLPALDALVGGNTPIVPASTGFVTYVTKQTGWLVPVHETDAYGALDTLGDLYTASESWWEPDLPCLRKAMREAVSGGVVPRRRNNGMAARAFSLEAVGRYVKGLLHGEEVDRPWATRERRHPLVRGT